MALRTFRLQHRIWFLASPFTEVSRIEYGGYIGIMEKKMETTILYRVYMGVIVPLLEDIGIMEKNMETTILHRVYIGVIVPLQ